LGTAKMPSRRVVITGLGILSSVGIGKTNYWQAIRSGRSGIKPITAFNAETFPTRIAGEIRDFNGHDFFPHQLVRRLDRFALLGLAAAKEAVDDASLRTKLNNGAGEHACIVVGMSVGALAHAERTHALFLEKGGKRISPYFNSNVIPSSCATQIGMFLGIHGDVQSVTAACASGTSAIGEAFRKIRSGEYDIAIAGASESPITPLVTATFSTIGVLSTDNETPESACRPFSKDRNGTVIAEGAAMVVMETLEHAAARGARIYGEVVGYGSTFDSYHVLQPLPSAEYAARAIINALRDADTAPNAVDYYNAHGTASLVNDKAETLAIKKAFGEYAYRLPISSTKSLIGHTLGACGALEFVTCVLMLENQYLHPTLNLRAPDPECDLDYIPLVGRSQPIRTIVSNSTGFGGYNAACVIKKFDQ
jgi:3-oxoacyl-[acyl-carrier-protein] synthase II